MAPTTETFPDCCWNSLLFRSSRLGPAGGPLSSLPHSSGNPSYGAILQSCTLFCSLGQTRPTCQALLRGAYEESLIQDRPTHRWIYFYAHFTGEKWRQRLRCPTCCSSEQGRGLARAPQGQTET